MKKFLATLLAVVTLFSLAVNVFAADYSPSVTLGLYVGDTGNGWGSVDTVTVNKSGSYSLSYSGERRTLEWIIIKTATGDQQSEPTSIPSGTIIRITELKLDGVSYTFDGGSKTYDTYVGSNGTIEVKPWLNPAFGGSDHIDNNPKSASNIEVTFTVGAEKVEVIGSNKYPIIGDLDEDGAIDRNDALYVLYYSLFGNAEYPVNQDVDFDGDNSVSRNDAIHLLYNSLFPNEYPLTTPAKFTEYARNTMVEKETTGSTTQFDFIDYPTYEHVTYYSNTCKRTRGVNIMLPANYDENKEYPVLYALHGYWGDEYSLLDETGYAPIWFKQVVGNAVANGEAVEMIVVIPYIYASDIRDAIEGGIDATNNAAYDNFVNDLYNDLMPFIEENYSIKKGRENTAITGFSMGGRESIYIGLTHPETFGYVGAVCPAPGVDSDLLRPNEMVFKNNQIPYLFYITAGSNDGVVGETPAGYHNIFNNNRVDHVWHYINGGTHDGVSIRAHLHNFVRYIFKAN